jgi:hypothetical protein
MKTAPYTIFGKTKQVPIRVVQNNETIETDEWDENLWIKRGEDWYALGSPQLKGKRVKIIEREVWLRCRE